MLKAVAVALPAVLKQPTNILQEPLSVDQSPLIRQEMLGAPAACASAMPVLGQSMPPSCTVYSPPVPLSVLVPPVELKLRAIAPSAAEVPTYAKIPPEVGSGDFASIAVTRVSTALRPEVSAVKFSLT